MLTYDLNGNINSLVRKGFDGLNLDNLSYGYTGNQLNYVHDTGSSTLGFVNGNTGTDDYSYDGNGNLNKDRNKGINTGGDIRYNFLNLPEEIRKGPKEKVKYIYDASGRKLGQEVYNLSGVLVKTTDYIGEMIYENDALQSIQHADGRVLPDGSGWEYQYYLKDHLGNVRITFTTKTQTTTSTTANFESATNAGFQNYSNTTFDLVDHTDAGTTYNKVQWLNGGVNGRVGVAKSMDVMPGDEVTISSWVKYMNLGSTANSNALITSLSNAFGVSSGSTGEALKIYNGLNSFALTVPAGDHTNDDEGAPKAFVTILFFDKDYNLIDAAWDQVTTTGAQTSPTVKQPPHDLVSITARAPEAGYAFVFVSNEHPNFVDIYFDDVTVSHTPSPIVSVSDYFPFGLQFNAGERTGATDQKYLYNGKELQDEMALNWYDYGARMYMPEIGRWGVLDPLAEKASSWTPYRYAFDNPLTFIDPDGRFEYSDGYTTWESRNSTGSISFSGTYRLGSKSTAAGTIVLQDLDETRSNSNRNDQAAKFVDSKFKSMNVNLTTKVTYGTTILSRKAFRAIYGRSSYYILVGSKAQLERANDLAYNDGGWKTMGSGHEFTEPGTTYAPDRRDYTKNERMAFIRSDLMSNTISQRESYFNVRLIYDNYSSPAERLAFVTMHEMTHSLFSDHPDIERNREDIDYDHHPSENSIMYRLPSREALFDFIMINRLLEAYGTANP